LTHSELLGRLVDALAGPLPGSVAQARMAPQARGNWPAGFDMSRLRHAAGLLLLFPIDDRPHVVLTVRSRYVRHAGQVSLPGGVIEAGESAETAALREAREEVAFAADDVRVLGALTPLDIPVSGFRLHPVLAALDRRPSFTPSDREVSRILEIPVATLLDPATIAWRPMKRGALELDVPAFVTQEETIWGATAMVLAEFLTLVGWLEDLPGRS
jgi:8-oxo-dGTP pyrophosphatase MutT (NUDIX family)